MAGSRKPRVRCAIFKSDVREYTRKRSGIRPSWEYLHDVILHEIEEEVGNTSFEAVEMLTVQSFLRLQVSSSDSQK